MTSKNIAVFLFLLFWSVGNFAFAQTFPASILKIELHCVKEHRTPVATTKSIPPQVISWKISWAIDLVFIVSPSDSSFWENIPFAIEGKLPNGKRIHHIIDAEKIKILGSVVEFSIQIMVDKTGWADFILTDQDSKKQLDLYDYQNRSNKRSVQINCEGLK